MDVSVHPDRTSLAQATASLIVTRAAEGEMTLGLAGGSTPADTYDALGDFDVDWSRISLWLSDERWVPLDHPDSNGRMAISQLPAAAHDRLVRPRFSKYVTPADSAVHYDASLHAMHGDRAPDVVLLGMGTDGHTASLFPGTEALYPESHRWYVENHVPDLDTWRLTATPKLLCAATRVIVLVAGSEKASVLAEVLEGPDGTYPIQLLRSASGEVTVMCDRAAASGLSG